MKGTFDKEEIKFYVKFNKSDSPIEFEAIYGLGPTSIEETLILYAESKNSSTHRIGDFNYTEFNIPVKAPCLTYEDAIKCYFDEHYKEFNRLQMTLALCFLQRYCMDYEEVKKEKEKYVKILEKNIVN